MFERDNTDAAGSNNLGGSTDILVFLGSVLVFPNSILRISEQEAGGVHAIRVESLRDLLRLARDSSFCIRKVFFDDHFANETLRSFDRLRQDVPDADWILAYRDKAVARRLLRERSCTAHLADILLLPMSLSICPWSSMLRLVLSGQFIASGDLIGTAEGNGAADDPVPLPEKPDQTDSTGIAAVHLAPQSRIARPDNNKTERAQMTIARTDPGLTRREKEVLAHVSQGGRNKTIAHQMSLSEHTVKLHLHNAITKIGARNRTEAATWYLSRQMGERHDL